MVENERKAAIGFYFKLWKCLKLALSREELECQANAIVVQLGKSIESQYTYYNAAFDVWCTYFLHS